MNISEQNILTDLTKDDLIFHQIVFPLECERISELIDSVDKNSQSFIYYSKPFSETEYLAVDKLFQIENSIQSILELDEIISNFRENVSAGNLTEDVPIFFGYVKFPSTIKENTWKNFKEVSWFIPKFLFFKKENKLYCAQNFLLSSLQDDLHLKHTEEFQNFIKETTNNFYKEKTSATIKRISDEDFEVWKRKVVKAVNEIKENKLQKIVLTRKVEYKISGHFFWKDVFEKLNSEYPDCMNFLIKSQSDYFFGSSPELLAAFDKSDFRTEALAGSINRGSDEYEDSDLALLLSASIKNKKEHDFVIDHLRDNLQKHLIEIVIDETPVIKRLKNIQHLQTKINGKLKHQGKYFKIIQSIFPTPAICGIPTNLALNELELLEGFDRGLFSGIVGNFNLYGKAEFFVALRSALISNDILSAFAGCGIVEESVPEEEFQETELKLKPITSLFQNENQS